MCWYRCVGVGVGVLVSMCWCRCVGVDVLVSRCRVDLLLSRVLWYRGTRCTNRNIPELTKFY